MDRKSMMEKFIEHEKSAFNSLVGSMSAIQDQAEESLSFFLDNNPFIPEQGKSLIKDITKRSRESFKQVIDTSFERIEPYSRDTDETAQWEENVAEEIGGDGSRPDVLLDVPTLDVDEIRLKVETLKAHVAVLAEVANLVRLNVGADVEIGDVDLDIKGVEAKALLKVRLRYIYAILARTLQTLDRHPEIIQSLASLVGETGKAVGKETGKASGEIGEGAARSLAGMEPLKQVSREVAAREGPVEEAVKGVSEGVGQAVKGASDVKVKERRRVRKTKLDEKSGAGRKKPQP